jgi:hypothetical protein
VSKTARVRARIITMRLMLREARASRVAKWLL